MTTSFFPYFPGNSSMSYDPIKQSCPGIAYQWLVFFPKQAPGFSFERLNGKRLLPGLAVAWIGNYSPSQNRPGHNSNPVPNCLNAQQFNGALLRNRIS